MEQEPKSIREAVRLQPDTNVAIVSVPGEYAALEAHHALTSGLHVLLFSDGVPLEEEVELKTRASELGLLVMGPGAGTAVLGGTGLGFANVPSAPASGASVGVVAAAGTGAQEVSALLDRWGVHVSQVIGVGGRDLSATVGGAMARPRRPGPRRRPGDTGAVLLVSKPPAPGAAARVLEQCGDTPAVAVFLGLDGAARAARRPPGADARARRCGRRAAGRRNAALARGGAAGRGRDGDRPAARAAGRRPRAVLRRDALLRGPADPRRLLGPVHSNEPLRPEQGLPAPDGAHVLLDLGAEEYTRGVPHPMIDPTGRLELLRRQGDDPAVAVVLLDVVLGHGAHEDPAGRLAPVCAELMAGGGPQVVAYVLGTEKRPAGVLAAARRPRGGRLHRAARPTRARRYAAAALALRRPELAEEGA